MQLIRSTYRLAGATTVMIEKKNSDDPRFPLFLKQWIRWICFCSSWTDLNLKINTSRNYMDPSARQFCEKIDHVSSSH